MSLYRAKPAQASVSTRHTPVHARVLPAVVIRNHSPFLSSRNDDADDEPPQRLLAIARALLYPIPSISSSYHPSRTSSAPPNPSTDFYRPRAPTLPPTATMDTEERLFKFRMPQWLNSVWARNAGVYAAGGLVSRPLPPFPSPSPNPPN